MKLRVCDIRRLVAEAMPSAYGIWAVKVVSNFTSSRETIGYVQAMTEEQARQKARLKFGKRFTGNYGEVERADARQVKQHVAGLNKEYAQLQARMDAITDMLASLEGGV